MCWRVPDRSVFGRKTDEVAAKMWLFDRFPSAGVLQGSVSSAFLFLEIFSLGRAFSPLTNSNLILFLEVQSPNMLRGYYRLLPQN